MPNHNTILEKIHQKPGETDLPGYLRRLVLAIEAESVEGLGESAAANFLGISGEQFGAIAKMLPPPVMLGECRRWSRTALRDFMRGAK